MAALLTEPWHGLEHDSTLQPVTELRSAQHARGGRSMLPNPFLRMIMRMLINMNRSEH
jgi:hypothetical protein